MNHVNVVQNFYLGMNIMRLSTLDKIDLNFEACYALLKKLSIAYPQINIFSHALVLTKYQ